MVIQSGANRTVHYFSPNGSPSEQAALKNLERAENEATYADALLDLRRQYVGTEAAMEPRRRKQQLSLYGMSFETNNHTSSNQTNVAYQPQSVDAPLNGGLFPSAGFLGGVGGGGFPGGGGFGFPGYGAGTGGSRVRAGGLPVTGPVPPISPGLPATSVGGLALPGNLAPTITGGLVGSGITGGFPTAPGAGFPAGLGSSFAPFGGGFASPFGFGGAGLGGLGYGGLGFPYGGFGGGGGNLGSTQQPFTTETFRLATDSKISQDLSHGIGDEGKFKNEMVAQMARQATPEYAASATKAYENAVTAVVGAIHSRPGGRVGYANFEQMKPRKASVVLKDKETITGLLLSEDKDWIVIKTEDSEVRIRPSEVVRIKLESQK